MRRITPFTGVVMAAAVMLTLAGCSTPADTDEPQASDAPATGCEVDAGAEQISEDAAAHMTELCEAAQDAGETELNLISALPDDVAGTIAGFTERFGIEVNVTEELGPALATDLQGQIQSGNYVTDVLHNPDGQRYLDFAEPYHVESITVPEELAGSADELQSPDDLFTTPAFGFFGLGVFEPRAGELNPQSWADLAKPEYAGIIGMGDPTVPGPNQDALVNLTLNGGLTDEQLAGVLENSRANMKGTFGDAVAGLMQGQYAFLFAAPSSSVAAASDQGAPVRFELVTEHNHFVTHKHLLLKNAPHPNAAKLYLEYLNTMTAQKLFAADNQAPLNTAAAADSTAERPWTDWKAANVTEVVSGAEIDAAREQLVARAAEILGK